MGDADTIEIVNIPPVQHQASEVWLEFWHLGKAPIVEDGEHIPYLRNDAFRAIILPMD